MSGGRMPNCPASASNGFSSTPVKTSLGKDLHTSKGLDDGVLSDDEDTFSLLSPIYHDSFDSNEDLDSSPAQQTSPRQSDSRLSVSPVRCELPRHSVQMLNPAVGSARPPTLSAWELWLVNKAKEDRFKLEKEAEEEWLRKEKEEQQERERDQKKIIMEGKIQEWLKMKREQEKQELLLKLSKEEEEIQRQQEKQRTQRKAQQKYKDWLQKKNQEQIEMERKEKEEAALKEEQEKERRKRAQEKFKDWLAKANEKSRTSPKSPCCPTNPYDKSHPSPSFYNPVPWKPIPVPPPETSLTKTAGKKPQRPRKCQQISGAAFKLRNSQQKR